MWTLIFDPNLFDERKFFLMTAVKLSVMMTLALGGGMLCRHFLIYSGQFENTKEFWASIILFPPIMTLAKAFSPHSMDTPIMMLIGFSLLFGICVIF